MPWRGKEWLPRELSPYLLGMMKGEKVTCHVFCLIRDDLLPLQPIKCNIIYIHFPRHFFMPVFILAPNTIITLSIATTTEPEDSPQCFKPSSISVLTPRSPLGLIIQVPGG